MLERHEGPEDYTFGFCNSSLYNITENDYYSYTHKPKPKPKPPPKGKPKPKPKPKHNSRYYDDCSCSLGTDIEDCQTPAGCCCHCLTNASLPYCSSGDCCLACYDTEFCSDGLCDSFCPSFCNITVGDVAEPMQASDTYGYNMLSMEDAVAPARYSVEHVWDHGRATGMRGSVVSAFGTGAWVVGGTLFGLVAVGVAVFALVVHRPQVADSSTYSSVMDSSSASTRHGNSITSLPRRAANRPQAAVLPATAMGRCTNVTLEKEIAITTLESKKMPQL